MQTPVSRSKLESSSVRFDAAELKEWETLLALDYPEVNRSLEIRRLIHRDIAERKTRENGRAA